jgi:hypothetical protein
MSEEELRFQPRKFTNPRVYPLKGDILMIDCREGLFHLNKATMKMRSTPRRPVPDIAPAFERQGEVFVARAGFGSVVQCFHFFKEVHTIGNVGFYTETINLQLQLESILDEAFGLNSGDPWDWCDSHAIFSGSCILEAAETALCHIGHQDMKISWPAIRSLDQFFRHADHVCYIFGTAELLRIAADQLRQNMDKNPDPETRSLIKRALSTFDDIHQRGFL